MKFNISQIVPRIAKRARVSGAARITLLITALFSHNVYAQNTGTPSQIRVKVDANNYLILVAAAQTSPISSPTVFTNIRLRTDSSNQLYVVVTGNITPTTITCSGSTGTTSSVLVGGNPCTWSSTPTLVGLNLGTSTARFQMLNSSTQSNYYFGTGAPTAIYYRSFQNSSTDLGFGALSVSLGLGNPAIEYNGISANGAATYPVLSLYTYRSQGSNSLASASGILFGLQNFQDESNSLLWCRTDAVNCTTTVGGGTLKYIYDFSRQSTSILKFAIGRFTASILADVDNTIDIGASGATRPRTVYAGTSIVVPTVNATTAYQVGGTAITSGTTLLTSGSGMAVANVGANSCGTTTATIAGNNNLFTITVGATAGTQCRVTFTVTATTAWGMVCADDTTTVAVRTTAVDTTHVDAIGTFTAGDQITCIAHPR